MVSLCNMQQYLHEHASMCLLYNTMYVIMCIFTYTCSQKHNNLSDGITMLYATLRNIQQLDISAL